MFEKATRIALRFPSSVGLLSVEQVWDLPLQSFNGKPNLDDLARFYHNRLKYDANVSFVAAVTPQNEDDKLAFDIVKHIIKVKLDEKTAADNIRIARDKRQKLLEIIAKKEEGDLMGASIEDLRKMVEGL